MARVTVEDCVQQVPNRFELILFAAYQTRQLKEGAIPTVPRENNKNAILALREIAERGVLIDDLYANLVQEYQKTSKHETSDPKEQRDPNNETKSTFKQDLILAHPTPPLEAIEIIPEEETTSEAKNTSTDVSVT